MIEFVTFIRKMFGLEQNTDQILKPITKIVNKLERHAEDQAAQARAHKNFADQHRFRAAAKDEESTKAARRAAKVSEFLG